MIGGEAGEEAIVPLDSLWNPDEKCSHEYVYHVLPWRKETV